jgi:hypothetical protein
MDIAVATELFTNMIIGCRTLGIEEQNIPSWQRMIDKMPPYLVESKGPSAGALKEWATPLLEEYQDHRHSSHLYMLYYDIPQAFRENNRLMDAAKKAYELRRELRINSKGEMAFGLIQCGMAAAHLHDAEMVEALLIQMAQNNYYPTYASSHNAGPQIFNTDISGCLPALMLEAIAQSSPVLDADYRIISYTISLLPALPDCMQSGSVRGLRLRGGYSLDMTWKDKKVVSFNIIDSLLLPYTVSKP